jgi:hypothetical protein
MGRNLEGGSTSGKIIWHIKGGEGREKGPEKGNYQETLIRDSLENPTIWHIHIQRFPTFLH